MSQRRHSSLILLPGALLQVNSETDFVAKNERFRELVKSIAQTALDADLPVASGQPCTSHVLSVIPFLICSVKRTEQHRVSTPLCLI